MCPGTERTAETLPGRRDPLRVLGMTQVYFALLVRLDLMDESPKYWFNTKTSKVEQGHKSLAMDRIGPFESHEEAANAFEILAARAKAQRELEEAED